MDDNKCVVCGENLVFIEDGWYHVYEYMKRHRAKIKGDKDAYIAALEAVAEAARKVAKINPSGDWACYEWNDNQPLFDLKAALDALKAGR